MHRRNVGRERTEDGASAPLPEKQEMDVHARNLWIIVFVFCSCIILVLGYIVNRLGFLALVPRSMKVLDLDDDAVLSEIAGHTFLFVGGPHRGGTTLLWKCLRAHPSVGGFPDRVGADYSEGIFLQSVYPTFGIGGEAAHGAHGKAAAGRGMSTQGLGRYAFDPESHLTETSELATDEARTRLFNEWGFFWDLKKPFLLEKSPPNMMISRFLQRLFTAPLPAVQPARERPPEAGGGLHLAAVGRGLHIGADGSSGGRDSGGEDDGGGANGLPEGTSARFIFITRHPVANAMALSRWTGQADIFEGVLHWLIGHETLAADLPLLKHSHVLTLEAFARDPGAHLRDLYDWLGLPAAPPPLEVKFDPRPNRRYEERYCAWVARSMSNAGKHLRTVKKLNERVKALGYGYDLEDVACLPEAVDTALSRSA